MVPALPHGLETLLDRSQRIGTVELMATAFALETGVPGGLGVGR